MEKKCKHKLTKWKRIDESVCTYKATCEKCGAEFIQADKSNRKEN